MRHRAARPTTLALLALADIGRDSLSHADCVQTKPCPRCHPDWYPSVARHKA